jgi:hypothetical protein
LNYDILSLHQRKWRHQKSGCHEPETGDACFHWRESLIPSGSLINIFIKFYDSNSQKKSASPNAGGGRFDNRRIHFSL